MYVLATIVFLLSLVSTSLAVTCPTPPACEVPTPTPTATLSPTPTVTATPGLITYISSRTYNNFTGGNLFTLARPTGTVAGDLLVATIAGQSYSFEDDITPDQAGWQFIGFRGCCSLNFGVGTWYRWAQSDDPASWTFTLSGGAGIGNEAGISAYRNVNPACPIEMQISAVQPGTGTYTYPTVTTGGNNRLLVLPSGMDSFLLDTFGGNAWSPITGGIVEEYESTSNDNGIASFNYAMPAAGSSGTLQVHVSDTSAGDSWVIGLIPVLESCVTTPTPTASPTPTLTPTVTPTVTATPAVPAWSKRFGSATGDDRCNAIAAKSDGTVVVTGQFAGTVDFGGGSLEAVHLPFDTSGTVRDIVLAKYDSSGTYVWAKQFGADAQDQGNAVALDSAGNVILGGQFQNDVNFGGGVLLTAGGNEAILAKYDGTNSSYIWAKRFGTAGDEFVYGVTVDASDNVIATGKFENTLDFGGGSLTSQGSGDIFLVKFTGTGTHVWSKRLGGVGADYGVDVVTDVSGDVYVAGRFAGSVDFGGGFLTSAGDVDVFVAKYGGSDGHYIWAKRYGGLSADYPQKMGIDSSSNVTVGGSFAGTVNFGGGNRISAGGNDGFIASYAGADGSYRWDRQLGSPSTDSVNGLAVTPSGTVLVTGGFNGTVNFGGASLTASAGADMFAARYTSSGAYIAASKYGSSTNQYGKAIASDGVGTSLACGYFQNIINFGQGNLTSAGSYDISIARLP